MAGQSPPYSKQVYIVVVGRGGTGKSTLVENIFDVEPDDTLFPDVGTIESYKSCLKNGIEFVVTDTPGLGGYRHSRDSSVREMSKYIRDNLQGRTDLLLFCISVGPRARFDSDGNPQIMESLQNAFGRRIWKQCVVAFTFSNYTLNWMEKNYPPKEAALNQYRDHIQKYATNFEKELRNLKVYDVTVKTPFSTPGELPKGHTEIMAIPAGDDPKDTVFPGVEGSWTDVFIAYLVQVTGSITLQIKGNQVFLPLLMLVSDAIHPVL